ncbi:MAG: NusA antitermination factor [candidate division WS6 bacterium GW2011_GWF2_39_15]|uniref:Transcription termination/antitermination protein NusA n=1 Tax=candidate division WS6 bacterium GW2011_GWF2_39_15 TaxID=1619100 RepID=A0A0G0MYM1_9BACT|nr:MAG: NusA antitermination factor [candidate division WS6 bacterium GW2011_GWF2_39_15]
MAIVTDFLAAINQIASERGIDANKIYDALKEAILIAYKKEYFKTEAFFTDEKTEEDVDEHDNLSIELNRENGTFRVIARKEVVKKVTDDTKQISVKDAQVISKDLKEGDVIEVELPSDDFGRIAAQTAKQVVLQKIREFEKEAVLSEFSGKIGQVFTALMQRMQRGDVVFEIGKATAYMPVEEQISNEFYKVGERYKVLLKDIVDTPRGKELVVSRADPKFLIELFKMEVPEIESGVVEVKAVAREAGSRSKMAVSSNQEGVDPIGSCVGQRGIRIANVMSELGEEKIDIIEWAEELEGFIANALSPAKVENVKIKGDTATVKVADDQLSLAIGRDGQNVRLAWKLTNMKIDIVGSDGTAKKAEKPVEAVEETPVEEIKAEEEVKEEEVKAEE